LGVLIRHAGGASRRSKTLEVEAPGKIKPGKGNPGAADFPALNSNAKAFVSIFVQILTFPALPMHHYGRYKA